MSSLLHNLLRDAVQLARKLERLAEEWTFVGTKTESYGDMQKLIVSIIRGSELMFEELTGKPINQIVILVVTENGTVQEFIKDKQEYIPLLEETLEEWYKT